MYMADLAVAYPGLSSKGPNSSRVVWKHLYSACEPSKIERYPNNGRIRMAISPYLVDTWRPGRQGPGLITLRRKDDSPVYFRCKRQF